MAFITDSSSLEKSYQTLPAGNILSYDTLSLNPALPDVTQLSLVWKMNTVFDSNNAAVSLAAQSDGFVAAAQLIQTDKYVVDTVQKEIDATNVSESTFEYAGATYTRPELTGSNVAVQPLIIRRSTDVTSSVVSYQPGARLTSEMLNTSEAQTLNAIQELTVFSSGGSGGSADVDPSSINITELAGVNLTSTGIVNWDASASELTSTGAGNLVPQDGSNNNDAGTFLKQLSSADGDIDFTDITIADVDGLSTQLLQTAGDISSIQSTLNSELSLLNQEVVDGVLTQQVLSNLEVIGNGTTAAGTITAASVDAGSGISFGDLEVGITARETTDNTGDMIEVNVGGDENGSGNISYFNGDDQRLGFHSASGYQYWWAPGEGEPGGGGYGRYVLIDPQASSDTAQFKIQHDGDTFITYQTLPNEISTSMQSQSGRKINSNVNSTQVKTSWTKDGNNYTEIAGNNISPRIAVVTNGATRMSVDNSGNLSANNFTPTSDGATKNYNVLTPAPTSVAEKFKNLSTLDTYERIGLEGEILYGPTIQDLAAVGLDLAEGPNNPDGDRTMDLLSTVGLLMQAVKELTERIETLEGGV